MPLKCANKPLAAVPDGRITGGEKVKIKKMQTKKMTVEQGKRCNISRFPNFHRSGSIRGMKKQYYGKDALLVRCGQYIYNVTSEPAIYNQATI